MAERIRGQEATLLFIVDGVMKAGSFTKATSFNLTPRIDLTDTDFLGELTSQPDVMYHGCDADAELEHMDDGVIELLKLIIAREEARLAHPSINIVVMLKWRASTQATTVMVLENCKVKVDNLALGGRKEYAKSKISMKCRTLG